MAKLKSFPDMRSMSHVLTKLLYLSPERSLLYVTDTQHQGQPTHVFEHLSCFLPGLLALGVHSLPSSAFTNITDSLTSTYPLLSSYNLSDLHMWAATGLADTCWLMYADQPTGLGPEEVLMRTPESPREHPRAFNDSNGLWLDAMERWRLSGQDGSPPGIQQKKPEPDSTRKDYEVRKAGYLLRPEVYSTGFYKCFLVDLTGCSRRSSPYIICGKSLVMYDGGSEAGRYSRL